MNPTHSEKLSATELRARTADLLPLVRDHARDAELARQPHDAVIEAVRESGLFAMMVPERFGGHEADLDVFFDCVLALAEADASTGWVVGFYIEHNWWLLNFPEHLQHAWFAEQNHVLAPGALSMTSGRAKPVAGGYRLSGQWPWGTGIVHATWVLAGALAENEDGHLQPMFFALPKSETRTVDTWQMAGMCGTGSHDFAIDDVFVPAERTLSFVDMLTGNTVLPAMHPAPLYRTPMMIILGLAASLPCLGAARSALHCYAEQLKEKRDFAGKQAKAEQPSAQFALGEAALRIDGAESNLRRVLHEVMAERDLAARQRRAEWMARIAYAVSEARLAVDQICAAAGASANRLDNPLQRARRDINTAACHVVFEREGRIGDWGRLQLGLEASNALL